MSARKRAEHRPRLEIETRVVENPLWSRDHDGAKGNARYVEAQVNIRESAVSALARNDALDAAQVLAATRFRALWEAMGGAGARGIDTTREFVDGGRFPEPIGDAQINAGKNLAAAYEILVREHGLYAWRVVGYICGQGVSARDMTSTRRQRDTLVDNLRAYLDCLADHWGYRTNAQGRRGDVRR